MQNDLIHVAPGFLRAQIASAHFNTSDLLFLLLALDCTHVDTVWPLSYERAPVLIEHPVRSGGEIRRLTGVTSSTALERLRDRMLSLKLVLRIDDEPRIVRPIDYFIRKDAHGTSPRPLAIATDGNCARYFGASGDYLADAVQIQAEWLRGLTAPAAWVALRYLIIRFVGVKNAAIAARGGFRVDGGPGAGEVTLTFDHEGWLFNAFGRPFVTSAGTLTHASDISRCIKQTASELLTRGISMTWRRVGGYRKPRWLMTLAGPGPANFAVDFAGRVEPLSPEPSMPIDSHGALMDDHEMLDGFTTDPDGDDDHINLEMP